MNLFSLLLLYGAIATDLPTSPSPPTLSFQQWITLPHQGISDTEWAARFGNTQRLDSSPKTHFRRSAATSATTPSFPAGSLLGNSVDSCFATQTYGGGNEFIWGNSFSVNVAGTVLGVRVYATSSPPPRVSLWNLDTATLLQSTLVSGSQQNQWVEVLFSAPTVISPGMNYYVAPDTNFQTWVWPYEWCSLTPSSPGPGIVSNTDSSPYVFSGTTDALIFAAASGFSPWSGVLVLVEPIFTTVIGVSSGDPHIAPFMHPQFPFTLPTAHKSLDIYNYITLSDFQQNCRFIKYPGIWNGEYVIEVGMLIRDPRSNAAASTIAIGSAKHNNTWSLKVLLDDIEMTQTTTHTKLFTTEQRSASQVTVEFAMLRVDISLKFAHGLPYLNLKEEALLPEVLQNAHGLIGQSARPEVPYKTPRKECFECFVQGTMEDYRIQSGDLFGMDFKYNLFEEKK